jgi:hypothetical protein
VRIALPMVMLCISSGVSAEELKTPQQRVIQAIVEIRSASTSELAAQAAERFGVLTSTMRAGDINGEVGADLTSLLEIPNEALQFWVAASLANLGVKKSIPVLLTMLPAADCETGDLTAGTGIRTALEQLGHPPPPNTCEHPKHPLPCMNDGSKPCPWTL